MSIRLPQPRIAEAPKSNKRQIPLEAILQVMGRNPYAEALNDVGPALSQALQKRAELRRNANAVGQMATAAGETPPTDLKGLTPDLYGNLLTIKNNKQAKLADAAKSKVDLELKLEQARKGYVERDPLTGAERSYPGVQDLNIIYDEAGNPAVQRGPDYAPGQTPKSAGGAGGRGANPTLKGTTPDGVAVSYDPRTRQNVLPNGTPYSGTILPITVGTEEQRRQALVSGAQKSIGDIRTTLARNPGVLAELKGITLSPGKVYAQLASSDAKQFYINLREAIANEIYLKTGATANDQELENASVSYLAALNDNPQDFLMRMGLLERNISPFNARSGGLQPIPTSGSPKKVGRFVVEVE